MANYRFGIRCWQDKVGTDNAKINVSLDGASVLSEAVVSGEAADDTTYLSFEKTGEAAAAADKSFTIKVELANDHYVDENEDRNVYIDFIGVLYNNDNNPSGYWRNPAARVNITDFTGPTDFLPLHPTAITADSLAGVDLVDANSFLTIPILGGDTGVTITVPSIANGGD